MDEVWRSVPSLDGVKASSLGRILLPQRISKMPNGGERKYSPKPRFGKPKKSSKSAKHVYLGIYTRHYGNIKVHKAVCEAFHGPKPFDGAVVIHIDEDATNNRPENLMWGSQKENLNMPKIKMYHKSRTGENSPVAKHLAKSLV